MFASTPKTERPITPYLDPDASKKLQQLFFGNKDEGPKRSLKQVSISTPPQIYPSYFVGIKLRLKLVM